MFKYAQRNLFGNFFLAIRSWSKMSGVNESQYPQMKVLFHCSIQNMIQKSGNLYSFYRSMGCRHQREMRIQSEKFLHI